MQGTAVARQTDKQTGRQTDRQMDSQMDKQVYRQACEIIYNVVRARLKKKLSSG